MINETKTSPLNKILFILLLGGVLLLVFLGYFHQISAINQDLGRHLLTGQMIWENKVVPATNLYSYTYPDFLFINHHYLSEVLFYLVHARSGFGGLLFFTTGLMVLSFGLLYTFTSKRTSLLASTLTTLLFLPILFDRTELRPEILSYTFMIFFVVILFTFRERFSRWIYFLPLLSFLWANSHIYFPIGLLLILLFFLDSLWCQRKKVANRQTLTLLFIGVFSGMATLLNPHGLTGALYPLHVFSNYGYTIEENQTLFFLQKLGFHKASFLPFQISIVLLFTTLTVSAKKSRPIDWLLTISFTFIALSAVRNFPLFVFATIIPLSHSLTILFQKRDLHLQKRPILLGILSIVAVVLLIRTVTIVFSKPLGPQLPQGAQKALTFFQDNHLQGPIFNNFDIGSYIEYRLYPNEKVFIDGRPEAYPASFIQKTYIPMQEDPKVFAHVANTYHFNTIIFSHTDQTPWAQEFLPTILKNPEWETVYLDPMMIILLKKTPQNKALIEKYGMTYPDLTMRNIDNSQASLYQAAFFFSRLGLKQQEQDIYHLLLKQNPTDCSVLYQLALSEDQQNPLTLQRYNLYCH